eukprot:TRINITY_DN28669_c0_g1_i1.p1 TRINITY_DN28669_c0_g1~~TRINITY_DN28669_c0_g1_i1.p1  ORF type:complete len:375 (-),score=46.86 TRINITY_DN28669_c0_g1_i1:85-1176(-)
MAKAAKPSSSGKAMRVSKRPASKVLASSSLKKRPAAIGASTANPGVRHDTSRAVATSAGGSPDPALFGPWKQPKPKEIAALIDQSFPWKASMRPGPCKNAAVHVVSWNVNGITALLKANPKALSNIIDKEKPDVIFLQETLLQEGNVEDIVSKCVPSGWGCKWVCSRQPLGYAGVAALWRPNCVIKAFEGVGCPEADREGRCLTVELPRFYLVGAYVPNSGEGLKRLDFRLKKWEPAVAKHLASLQAKKPTIYCGDLNVSHLELDLWGNHAANSKGAGYSPQERQAFDKLLTTNGLVDSFRHKHPGVRAFSYFSYRSNGRQKNQGWRLDYCLIPAKLAPRILDAYIMTDVMGSDHCPVGLVLS